MTTRRSKPLPYSDVMVLSYLSHEAPQLEKRMIIKATNTKPIFFIFTP
jgi:hypothetical protein